MSWQAILPQSSARRYARASSMHRNFRSFLFVLVAIPFVEAFSAETSSPSGDASVESQSAIAALSDWIEQPRASRPPIVDQPFASIALTKDASETARKILWTDRQQFLSQERAAEMNAGVIADGELQMRFTVKEFGEKPADGWSVFISMHGGGSTSAEVNDQQWRNQQRLYQPDEGLYVTPRAPTDTWNMWHQAHIDRMFVRLIENLVALEDANPNRVYLLGYSAGGDGAYQLAPRLCDRWAAAAMMAGHPNDASPMALRNVPFALQVGALDRSFKRNEVAANWQEKLIALQMADPDGYQHLVKIYPKKGHWMNREDAIAIPWMSKFTRTPTPHRIVWKQDDVISNHCYWLSVESADAKPRSQVIAEVKGNNIELSGESEHRLTVNLDDRFVDMEQPIIIRAGGTERFRGTVDRTIANLFQSLEVTGDHELSFPGRIVVEWSPAQSE